ncbi:hypothetical protein AB0B30_31115 [Streptomyces narbonensis]|uniref:Uncharacterized protein n=1 Tax=Streptomyces narbonensis TaxID=67333 RepID=A0ABV3CGS9_9ACTN
MTRSENEVDQIVFRWDSENAAGSTGFGPVAWSGSREQAEGLFRISGPMLRASGDETRPALIRLHRRRGVMLIQRLPFTDADGASSVLCHALVGSPALLDPAACLGLHAWNWPGVDAAHLAVVRGRLPAVREESLLPSTGEGQWKLDEALAYAAEELTGAVAELLRRPEDRFTVLDERGDTACPVLWGLHSMFGALIDRRWTFATHDTAELPDLRFVFVGRWSGAASPNTGRRRVDPRERFGDRAEETAARLVRHHLRGVEDGDGREYAVSSALHEAAPARRSLLDTVTRALDILDTRARRGTPRPGERRLPPGGRTGYGSDPEPRSGAEQEPRSGSGPRRGPERGPEPRYGSGPEPRYEAAEPDPWFEAEPDPWSEGVPEPRRASGPESRHGPGPGPEPRYEPDPDPWFEVEREPRRASGPEARRGAEPDPRSGAVADPRYEAGREPTSGAAPEPQRGPGEKPGPRSGSATGPRPRSVPEQAFPAEPEAGRPAAPGSRYPAEPGPEYPPAAQDPRRSPVPPRDSGSRTPDSTDRSRPLSSPDAGRPPSSPDPWHGDQASPRTGRPPQEPSRNPTEAYTDTPHGEAPGGADPWAKATPPRQTGPAPDPARAPESAPDRDIDPVPGPGPAPGPAPEPVSAPVRSHPAPDRADDPYPRPVLPFVGPQWTGPAGGGRRVWARMPWGREREADTGLVHRLPTAYDVAEARGFVERAGSRELLDALRRPQVYVVVTLLLQEIAKRLPTWEYPATRELCEVVLGRELWATALPGAEQDRSEPPEEQRASNAAELHRWAVRPLLGGGDAPVGTVAALLVRLRTSPVPSAREAFWQIVDGDRPGLPDAVWLTLLKDAYGVRRTPPPRHGPPPHHTPPPDHAPPPGHAPPSPHQTPPAGRPAHQAAPRDVPYTPQPQPPQDDESVNGYTRRFLSRTAVVLALLLTAILVATVMR